MEPHDENTLSVVESDAQRESSICRSKRSMTEAGFRDQYDESSDVLLVNASSRLEDAIGEVSTTAEGIPKTRRVIRVYTTKLRQHVGGQDIKLCWGDLQPLDESDCTFGDVKEAIQKAAGIPREQQTLFQSDISRLGSHATMLSDATSLICGRMQLTGDKVEFMLARKEAPQEEEEEEEEVSEDVESDCL
eukprot:CAMPEP_0169250634 /NCGR_PEP_ID=MMETSP1016-20121227/37065_1 /TAXON_ID=342587 /ORGANISM="Karlodinium micrum, Strain CCMP2283" /LENGTH=189 /DNA_ID=CAMNT_0009331679 /DNA_START=46 /DNA_END=616 /DNA_ORIENTATION=-